MTRNLMILVLLFSAIVLGLDSASAGSRYEFGLVRQRTIENWGVLSEESIQEFIRSLQVSDCKYVFSGILNRSTIGHFIVCPASCIGTRFVERVKDLTVEVNSSPLSLFSDRTYSDLPTGWSSSDAEREITLLRLIRIGDRSIPDSTLVSYVYTDPSGQRVNRGRVGLMISNEFSAVWGFEDAALAIHNR